MATAPPLGITCYPMGSPLIPPDAQPQYIEGDPYDPYDDSWEYCETTAYSTATTTILGKPTTITVTSVIVGSTTFTLSSTVTQGVTKTISVTVTGGSTSTVTKTVEGGGDLTKMIIPVALIGAGGIFLLYSRKQGRGG